MRSGKIAGEAAQAESLAASDLIAKLAALSPVYLLVVSHHDRSDYCISAVWRLDTPGSHVSFALQPLATFAIVLFSTAGELGNELFIVGNDNSPAFDELADR
jgi:hypothetical protein